MAATSVLEPMVKLYVVTGDERYLAFCRYLVDSWDQPNGPKILASLLDHGKVNKTANGKAYEMMSNLVGLCELYRVVGDERYLKAARNAWEDIRHNQTYITGGVSFEGALPARRSPARRRQRRRDLCERHLDAVVHRTADHHRREQIRRAHRNADLQSPARVPRPPTATTGATSRRCKAPSRSAPT